MVTNYGSRTCPLRLALTNPLIRERALRPKLGRSEKAEKYYELGYAHGVLATESFGAAGRSDD